LLVDPQLRHEALWDNVICTPPKRSADPISSANIEAIGYLNGTEYRADSGRRRPSRKRLRLFDPTARLRDANPKQPYGDSARRASKRAAWSDDRSCDNHYLQALRTQLRDRSDHKHSLSPLPGRRTRASFARTPNGSGFRREHTIGVVLLGCGHPAVVVVHPGRSISATLKRYEWECPDTGAAVAATQVLAVLSEAEYDNLGQEAFDLLVSTGAAS
jgi:hypothetical protein